MRLHSFVAAIVLVLGLAFSSIAAAGLPDRSFIHVSPAGDDANAGTLAAPVRTIARAYALATDGGGGVLFERGGVWEDNWPPGWSKTGREGAPFVIGAYGDATLPRPVVHGVLLRFSKPNSSDVTIEGLAFSPPTMKPQAAIIAFGATTRFRVRDCDFHNVGLALQVDGQSATTQANGWAFERNVCDGIGSQGLLVSYATGMLIKDNVLIDCGPRGSEREHAMYLAFGLSDFIIERNIVVRSACNGISYNGNRGVIRHNIIVASPVGIFARHADISRNLITENPAQRPPPYPATGGFGIIVSGSRTMERGVLTITDNIVVQKDNTAGPEAGIHLNWREATGLPSIDATIRGTIIGNWFRNGFTLSNAEAPADARVTFTDNTVSQPEYGRLIAYLSGVVSPGITFGGNRYYAPRPVTAGAEFMLRGMDRPFAEWTATMTTDASSTFAGELPGLAGATIASYDLATGGTGTLESFSIRAAAREFDPQAIYDWFRARLTGPCIADGWDDLAGLSTDDKAAYLGVFDRGDVRADLDDGSGTGTPDGGVTLDDLLYYLARFEAGC